MTKRRTKIVATIGPASESEPVLRRMIEAGLDVARISVAHDPLEVSLDRYHRVRKVAADLGRTVGVLVDLPGPKIRAGAFPDGGVSLEPDREVRLVPGSDSSTEEVIHVGYDRLLDDIEVGDRLALGDGAVTFDIVGKGPNALVARVGHGGRVRGRPGIHIPSDRLRISSPTPEDLRVLDAFTDADVDMIALSLVRSAHDVRRVGTEPAPRGPLIVAKIETRAAVENLDGIIETAGAIMVARGDLGNECPIEEIPHFQKRIIRSCIAHGRPVITATQMLESMVHAPSPTRAEATDVANAIFDGTSAVMLSGETAIGQDPVAAVRMMARIAERADIQFDHDVWASQIAQLRHHIATSSDTDITDTMTMAACRAANALEAKAVIAITRTGFTVRAIARFRPRSMVLAFSPQPRTVRQLSLSWGSIPFALSRMASHEEMVKEAVNVARSEGHVRSGDVVAILARSDEHARSTDVLRIVRVP